MANTTLTKINNKYELYLPKHRAERPEWATGWEVERIESMMEVLNEGDLVVDVGTEEGDISALLCQKTGNIVLVEPNDKVWTNIIAIWEANKLPKPIKSFVGFASDKTDLKGTNLINGLPDIQGELISNHGFKELAYEFDVVPQMRIDDMGLPQVSLITIDVEGSEYEVIQGAMETIKRDKPFVYVSVHPEFMFNMFKHYTAELINLLKDIGYERELLSFDHEFHFKFYYPSNENKI
jgi:FkbM family methyltransferase